MAWTKQPNLYRCVWFLCWIFAQSNVVSGQDSEPKWDDEWILPPPDSSSAFNYVDVSSNQQINIHESIPLDQNITASLQFQGDYSEFGIVNSDCPFTSIPSSRGASLILNTKLDYESMHILYSCQFKLGEQQLKLLFVVVVDDNDNTPIFTTTPGTLGTFPENEKGFVYQFKAQDGDKGDNAKLIYTCKALQGDGSHFEMETVGTTSKMGNLTVVEPLDFENEVFYLLEITVTDREEDGLSSSIQVSLSVEDVGDMPPIWVKEVPILHIEEELKVGTEIFKVVAKDGDRLVNNNISYTLEDGRDKFAVDEDTGVVSLTSVIDRELLENSYFDLVIIATEVQEPTSINKTLSTVFIDDINDHSPEFVEKEYVFYVDEDFLGHLPDHDITVNDPDLRENGTYAVHIVSDDDNVTKYLELSPSGGSQMTTFVLNVNKGLLDYEDPEKRNISLKLKAVEEASKEHHDGEVSVTIVSSDVNDCSPVFVNTNTTEGTFQIDLKEDIEGGAMVMQLDATDADISPEFGTESIIYSFLESKASFYFDVEPKTGIISTLADAAFDYEKEKTLSFTVVATDMGGTALGRQFPLNVRTLLNVVIEDVNDEPPTFNPGNPKSAEVSETEEQGKLVVSELLASDRDSNPDLQLAIDWSRTKFMKESNTVTPDFPERTFDVLLDWSNVSTSSWSIMVGEPSSEGMKVLDWGLYDTVQLKIVVTDGNTEVNQATDEATLSITVLDVNDHDPSFDGSDTSFSVMENTTTVTSFGFVSATDADAANIITYSINWCSNDGLDYVKMNASSGELNLKHDQVLDYETTTVIECNVTAIDSDVSPRSATLQIKIDVIDINDCWPVFDEVPSDPIYVEENTKNGVIARLHATDADSGDFGSVKYLFTPNTLEGVDYFSINLESGEISVDLKYNDTVLDFETHPQPFSISIDARDNYHQNVLSGSLWTTTIVKIQLKDVNDNAPILPSTDFTRCFALPSESLKKNETVMTITATDKDEPGTPNSQIEYLLKEQKRMDGATMEKDLFRLDTENNQVGLLRVDSENLLDFYGNYSVTIAATDKGEPALTSEDVTYRICVQDVNNNSPIFSFPNEKDNVVYVQENATVGGPVVYDDGSGVSRELIVLATDKDYDENGRVSYRWTDAASLEASVFRLDEDTGLVTLAKKFNRAEVNQYSMSITASDNGYPAPRSTAITLTLNVRKVSQFRPAFPVRIVHLEFTENESEVISFAESIDPDNRNLLPNEVGDRVCYYIACGNAEYFQIVDRRNRSTTRKPLDREEPPKNLFFVVESSNDCAKEPDPIRSDVGCQDIDTSSDTYLNVSVKIIDENDNPPEFDGTMSGGILVGDPIYKVIFPLSVSDPDLNDELHCDISDEFSYSDESLSQVSKPFTIQDSTRDVLLNFEVQSNMKGFFTVNVTVEDEVGHVTNDSIKIYIVTHENQVTFKFNNAESQVQKNRNQIEEIFTTVFQLLCSVESIIGNETETSVLSHFVDEDKEQPVSSNLIQAYKTDYNMSQELIYRFKQISLLLMDIQSNNDDDKKIQNTFFALFIVCIVIILPLTATVIVMTLKSQELTRTVSALVQVSASKKERDFGSQDSGINRADIPNTNVFAVEGTNPLFNTDVSFDNGAAQFDSVSESSGDSILIGVENNLEFRGYREGQTNRTVARNMPEISDDDQSVDESFMSENAVNSINSNFTLGSQRFDK